MQERLAPPDRPLSRVAQHRRGRIEQVGGSDPGAGRGLHYGIRRESGSAPDVEHADASGRLGIRCQPVVRQKTKLPGQAVPQAGVFSAVYLGFEFVEMEIHGGVKFADAATGAVALHEVADDGLGLHTD